MRAASSTLAREAQIALYAQASRRSAAGPAGSRGGACAAAEPAERGALRAGLARRLPGGGRGGGAAERVAGGDGRRGRGPRAAAARRARAARAARRTPAPLLRGCPRRSRGRRRRTRARADPTGERGAGSSRDAPSLNDAVHRRVATGAPPPCCSRPPPPPPPRSRSATCCPPGRARPSTRRARRRPGERRAARHVHEPERHVHRAGRRGAAPARRGPRPLLQARDVRRPAAQVASEVSPRPGVRIARDAFNVPHVIGDTRADTMYGAGYATAQDRLFFMDVLRHTGRARLTELIGPGEDDANVKADAEQLKVADYDEAELQGMIDRARGRRAGGRGDPGRRRRLRRGRQPVHPRGAHRPVQAAGRVPGARQAARGLEGDRHGRDRVADRRHLRQGRRRRGEGRAGAGRRAGASRAGRARCSATSGRWTSPRRRSPRPSASGSTARAA